MVGSKFTRLYVMVAALAVINLAPPVARAQELEPHIQLDLGFNTRRPDGVSLTTWAPNLSFYTQFDYQLALSAAWGLTAVNIDEDSIQSLGNGVESLNPFVALHVTPEFDRVSMRVGFGLAIPLAEGDSNANFIALRSAAATRGSWDPWLYEQDTLSFAIPLRLEWRASPLLRLAVDGATFLFVPVGGAPNRSEQLGFQGALEGLVYLGDFRVGARLQAVRPQDDDALGSFEPFAQFMLGDLGLHGKLTFNFNDRDSLAFDDQGIWAFHLGATFYFR